MPNTELMSRDNAYRWIEGVNRAAAELAEAMNAESELEDRRTFVKAEGIKRLMDAGAYTSVTAAEKNIEYDAEYLDHRAKQRDAVLKTIVARARYETAKLKARFSVERWVIEGGDGDVAEAQPPASVSAELNPANPVYRGLPWATLRTNPDGSIGAVDVDTKHDIPDQEKKAKAIETMRRTQRRNPEQATTNSTSTPETTDNG